jgi:ADP-ribosyl-[dinitrogen reductase] hydrolase
MIDNTTLLENLIDQRIIRLRKSPLLFQSPSKLSTNFNFDKVEGMLLGAAIGDSLGATSEGLSANERKSKFGEIRDYIPGERSKYLPIGVPTDDTQLTFWTLKQLIIDNGLIPDNLAKRFCKHHINGIGSTVKRFIGNYKDGQKRGISLVLIALVTAR